MLAELRAKSQITLPKALVDKLGLSVGDKLDIFEKEGAIHMKPLIVAWPKEFVNLNGSIDDDTFAEPEEIPFVDRGLF
ncbi:MAG: AbrB/MazE/SpoVT family DNA-binding domain-containing protein [Synergistaceae bacterium]|nr:AbrB/MazE/SpoVT family DNA-binding domain-containing protein [Synergistaceae bacterium]